jgi:hypothetical protein
VVLHIVVIARRHCSTHEDASAPSTMLVPFPRERHQDVIKSSVQPVGLATAAVGAATVAAGGVTGAGDSGAQHAEAA